MNNIALLKKLVDQNSFTENKKGVDAVGQIIQNELKFMKVEKFRHRVFGDLLIFKSKTNDPSKPNILLSGHSDTVYAPNFNFPLTIKGNYIKGPGTADMKGGLLVIIEALKQLYKDGKLLNLTFSLTPDEETSSSAHKTTLQKIYKQNDIALVYEESTSIIKNKPYSNKSRSVVIGRKGFGGAMFTIVAPGGHSGVLKDKKDRISAIHEAAYKIIELEKLADYKKGTTTNPGVIKGGTVLNAIAGECIITVDYRVLTLEERKRIRKDYEKLSKTNSIKGTTTKLEWLYDIPPMETTKNVRNLGKTAIKIGKKLGINITPEVRGGGSDANQIIQSGAAVIDGLGPQGGEDHTIKEFLYLDSIEPSIKLSTEIIRDLIK